MIPDQILSVDAQIIDDQPDHLVFAIRVPKSTLDHNLPFLAAVAERTAPHSPINARTAVLPSEATRHRKTARKAATVAAGGFVALVALMASAPLTAVPRPPIVWHDFYVETPVIRPGGYLAFTVVGHRHRLCKTDIDRAIVERDRDATVWRKRVEGMSQALTKEPIARQIKFQLPDGLVDGHYVYRATTFSDCGGGDNYALQSPDLHFEVRSW